MKLQQYREAYYEHSGKASDSARNLAFAGIAIVWLFRAGSGLDSPLPNPLLLPILLFAATLALDLLHYLVASVTWSVFCRIKEKKEIPEEAELDAPPQLNWAPLFLFYLKIASVMSGYALMIHFLSKVWLTGG